VQFIDAQSAGELFQDHLTMRWQIELADLPAQILQSASTGLAPIPSCDSSASLRDQVRQFEHDVISKTIQDAHGDRRMAAQRLGIGLSSLYRKIEDLESFGLGVEFAK